MCHNSLPHFPSSDRPDHIFVFDLFVFPLVYWCEFYENLDFHDVFRHIVPHRVNLGSEDYLGVLR